MDIITSLIHRTSLDEPNITQMPPQLSPRCDSPTVPEIMSHCPPHITHIHTHTHKHTHLHTQTHTQTHTHKHTHAHKRTHTHTNTHTHTQTHTNTLTFNFLAFDARVGDLLRASVLPLHQSTHETLLLDTVDMSHVHGRHLVRRRDAIQHACHRDRCIIVERPRDVVRLREVVYRLVILALLP